MIGIQPTRSSGSQAYSLKPGSTTSQNKPVQKERSIADCIFNDSSFESGWFQTLYPILEGFSPLGSLQTLSLALCGLLAKNKSKGAERERFKRGFKMLLQDLYDTIMNTPNTGKYRDGASLSNRNRDGSLKKLSISPK